MSYPGGDACDGVHIHNHIYPSDQRMEQALELLRQLLKGQELMSGSFNDVVTAITGLEGRVQGITDVTQGAVETLTELASLVRDVRTQLDTAGTEDERRAAADRLGALSDTLDARKDALAAAIASTDPTPAPQPAPAVAPPASAPELQQEPAPAPQTPAAEPPPTP